MLQQGLRYLVATLLAAASLADFAPVRPGVPLTFPRDYGAHPDFRTEWWYVTGWLRLPDGKEQGFQLTFFRSATGLAADNPSGFAPRQLIFAHAALSDPSQGRLLHDQRSARAGLGLAEAGERDTALMLDDWTLRRMPDGHYEAVIPTRDFRYQLTLTPSQPLILQGEAGYSRKGAATGLASYYYSQPQLKVGGKLFRGGKAIPVGGVAWLDHEWSSEIFDQATVGWDWVGLNLDNGGTLTAFRLRDAQGKTRWAGGSRRDALGKLTTLGPGDIHFEPSSHWTSPRTGVRYPVGMHLQLSGPLQESWQLEPLVADQELDTRQSTGTLYWEGAIRAKQDGKPAGQGYLELTGYGGRLKF